MKSIKITRASHTIELFLETFPDGDSFIDTENLGIEDEDISVFVRLYPDQNNNLAELLIILAHLKKKARSIKLLIPYMPYAREPHSFKVILDSLAKAGCDELHTIDCHYFKGEERATESGISIHNYSIKDKLLKMVTEPGELIAPDQGASYLCNNTMIKTRGEDKQVSTLELGNAKISKDHTIIIDDMISTGSTMIKAIELLKREGVKKITCLTAHGLFLENSYIKISRYVDRIICSDSVFMPTEVDFCEHFLMEKMQGSSNE